MTLADEIEALLGYPLGLPSDARVLLKRAVAAMRAPFEAKCPHECAVGVYVRFSAPGAVRHYSCLNCGCRWAP